MPTKHIILKRKLIKEGIICAVALAALLAGGMLLSDYDENAQAQLHAKESENTTMRSEHQAVEQELGTGFEVNAFFDAYAKNHNTDMLLKRDIATRKMSELREKNHLSNLSLTIAPVTDVTPEFGIIKSGTLTKSEVHLSFGAVTDNAVYGFIEGLERTLAGFVVVQEIKLNRVGDPSSAILVGLSQHKLTPLVNGNVTFTWLGVRPKEDDSGSGNDAAGDAPPGFPASMRRMPKGAAP